MWLNAVQAEVLFKEEGISRRDQNLRLQQFFLTATVPVGVRPFFFFFFRESLCEQFDTEIVTSLTIQKLTIDISFFRIKIPDHLIAPWHFALSSSCSVRKEQSRLQMVCTHELLRNLSRKPTSLPPM